MPHSEPRRLWPPLVAAQSIDGGTASAVPVVLNLLVSQNCIAQVGERPHHDPAADAASRTSLQREWLGELIWRRLR